MLYSLKKVYEFPEKFMNRESFSSGGQIFYFSVFLTLGRNDYCCLMTKIMMKNCKENVYTRYTFTHERLYPRIEDVDIYIYIYI